ncbi:MAG: hypothetical protein QF692_05980 [Alphaproteobacteria bacterium]|nr:hypothetical protein [Alphaproteobacteria bacterium]MDP7222793.1 hypothetical protein [Alphaproteobacteria bacterium]
MTYRSSGFLARFLIVSFVTWISGASVCAGTSDRQDVAEDVSVISMLVLDIENDGGVALSPTDGKGAVYWDIDLDGMAEAVGWVNPHDAILVIDKNGDGNIVNQSELFGRKNKSGFEVLAAYDNNQDRQITPEDGVWAQLYLWFDKRPDGYSQKGELVHLDDYHIKSISLDAESYPEPVTLEQRVSASSEFVVELENAGEQTFRIYNVLPLFDIMNTVFNKDYTLDVRTLFMPTLRGYGTLPDLHIAMSNDQMLLMMARDMALLDFETMMSPAVSLEAQFESLLFRWAKANDIPIDSRGPNISARRLAVVEAVTGRPFIQVGAGGTPNPLPVAASQLRSAYRDTFQNLFSQFMVQASGRILFTNKISYNPRLGDIVGTAQLNDDTLDIVTRKAKALPPAHALMLWTRYVRILNWHGNISRMHDEEIQKISDAIVATMPDKTFDDVLTIVSDQSVSIAHDLPTERLPFESKELRDYIAAYLDNALAGLGIALILLLIVRRLGRKSAKKTR